MRSDRPSLGLSIAAGAGVFFLLAPLALIILYAFSIEENFTWPIPGFTTQWFGVAFSRPDVWAAIWLSVKVALFATAIAIVLGTLAAAAVGRGRFYGSDGISLLFIIPIALPGIVTGIALRSAFNVFDIDFSTLTIILGHATFCIVVVYNNAVARFRRIPNSMIEASLDLGADGFQTLRHVVMPMLATALLAGGMLAFALSFDELIVTTFTAGQQQTLPVWMMNQLTRPRARPVTNVVAVMVILITTLPIIAAYYLTREGEHVGGAGK